MDIFYEWYKSRSEDNTGKSMRERIEAGIATSNYRLKALERPEKPEQYWRLKSTTREFREQYSRGGVDGKESRYLYNTTYGNVRADSWQTILDIYDRRRGKIY